MLGKKKRWIEGLLKGKVRPTVFYEKLLLVVAIFFVLSGFYLINNIYKQNSVMNWEMLLAIFAWLSLIILFVVMSLGVDIKEELGIVVKEQTEETKVLKRIAQDQLIEIKLLREDIKKRPK